MKKHLFLIILFLGMVVSACGTTDRQNLKHTELKQAAVTKTFSSSETAEISNYLAFAEEFSNASPEAQKQTLIATNQQLTLNANSLLHRFKLAMIYALPSSTLLDVQKAQPMLLSILRENHLTGAQTAYAHMLFDYVIALNKANKSDHEDEKHIESILQKNENLQSKLDSLQQKLASTQQKLDAAQQQIDELKNIEKSMGQREPIQKK